MNVNLLRIHKFLSALMLLSFCSAILPVFAQEDEEVDNATMEMRARFEALSKDVSINLPPTLILQEFIKLSPLKPTRSFYTKRKIFVVRCR